MKRQSKCLILNRDRGGGGLRVGGDGGGRGIFHTIGNFVTVICLYCMNGVNKKMIRKKTCFFKPRPSVMVRITAMSKIVLTYCDR